MTIVFILSYVAVFMFAVFSTKLGLYDKPLERFVEKVHAAAEPIRYPKPMFVTDPEPFISDILTHN